MFASKHSEYHFLIIAIVILLLFRELSETKKILTATEVELKEATNSAGESCQLLAQLEELKIKLRESEEAHVK